MVQVIDFRRLGAADLTACLDLAEDREWPREQRKWGILLDTGAGYGLDAPDGGLAAAGVLTTTGGLASISMVLVAARFGRQGLGRRVMNHLISEAGDAVLSLFATSAGQPLYDALGFEVVGGCLRMSGQLHPDDGPRGVPAPDPSVIYALDKAAYGVDRSVVLDGLLAAASHVHVVESGYAIAIEYEDRTVIGPVVAPDEAGARALIRGLARSLGEVPVRIDPEDHHPGLASWLTSCGLRVGTPSPRMVLGGRALPGDASLRFAVANQALG